MALIAFGSHGIYGAQTVGPALNGSSGNVRNIRHIRGELGDNRNVHCRFHRTDDFSDQVRILTHRHTVAFRMWAGQIEFEPVSMGRKNFCDLYVFCDASPENRNEQEFVFRNLQCPQQLSRALRARIRETDRIGETARLILGQNRFSIPEPGFRPDTLGGQYPHFGYQIEKALNDISGAGHDAGGDGKGTRNGFT